jgi:uncharacterized protein YeaO (DUF488 family)
MNSEITAAATTIHKFLNRPSDSRLQDAARLSNMDAIMAIQVKRAYEKPSPKDGARVLVDRLWPRGISKSEAQLEKWLRELAPSDALRKWYHGRDGAPSFSEFRKRYLAELSEPAAAAALTQLYDLAARHLTVTLIYGSKNEEQNNATVLRDLLSGMRKPPSSSGPARALTSSRRNRARGSK